MLTQRKIQAAVFSISLLMTLLPCSVAGPISFTPNGISNCGAIKGEVNVKALGSLSVRSGVATINGRVITLKACSEFTETPQTVLVGSILRSEANPTSSPPSVTGLALFLLGDWIEQIDDPSNPDLIFRSNGQLQGRIIGIENDSIALRRADGKQESVPLNSILYLRSPRVFVFKIDLRTKDALEKDSAFQALAHDASFRPTAAARSMSGSVIPEKAAQEQQNSALGNLSGAKTATPLSVFEDDSDSGFQPSFGIPAKKPPRMTMPAGMSFE
ncbi:MAG: hypothetical protein K2X77_22520 [Candidatus Obscuribacterales bacterium]|nr:hypothetical protein [Candidatus Obscuribacterales bacterium]